MKKEKADKIPTVQVVSRETVVIKTSRHPIQGIITTKNIDGKIRRFLTYSSDV